MRKRNQQRATVRTVLIITPNRASWQAQQIAAAARLQGMRVKYLEPTILGRKLDLVVLDDVTRGTEVSRG